MGNPLKVLMLEDRPADAELIVHELKRSGFDPDWKRVETEADFKANIRSDLDIILADYSLPQFDALRALHRLQDTGLEIPFIIITGSVSEEVAVECMKQGASDYLLKDRLTRLGPAIHLALEQANLHQREREAEDALQKSEARNQAILRSLNAQVAILDCDGRIIAVNDAWERYAQQNGDPELKHTGVGQNYLSITRKAAEAGDQDARRALDGILSVIDGRQPLFSLEYPAHSPHSKHWFLLYVTPLAEPRGGVVITHLEVTQRKLAEERLTLLSMALESADNAVIITDREGKIVWVNPAFSRLSGYTYSQAVGHLSHMANARAHETATFDNMWKMILDGRVWHSEMLNRRKDGSTYMAEITITPVRDESGQITNFIDIEQDITERTQHERELEAIVVVANALRSAKTRSEMLPVILDELITLMKADGGAISLYDPSTDEMVVTLVRGPNTRASGKRIPMTGGLTGHVVTTRQICLLSNNPDDPYIQLAPPGSLAATAGVPLIAQGQIVGIIWLSRHNEFTSGEARLMNAIADIAANAIFRATLYEETELRLQRLTALHEVDKAITASLDVRLTLSVLVQQVVSQLGVHAANVLHFNPETQALEFAASYGFRMGSTPPTRVSGQGFAQQAVIERKIITIPDVNLEPPEKAGRLRARGEEFIAYYAIPLITKGQVKGVLELFHRAAFYPDAEWMNFLETLAGQAAIAIENAEMFNSLQRSNINLAVAFNDTIEALSRALDMRDRETADHTRDLTDMAVLLARAAGIPESEMVHIRRGSLLHDIGKIAIPDSILQKTGPLNDEEWEKIRKHPEFAYDLLSPIDFLRPALDIPYCHHEHWDGSGYPRGLKGEEIPLSARIFSLVDVFQALTHDRYYRKAWTSAQAYDYIREQSGKQFDPVMVKLFLSMRWEDTKHFSEKPSPLSLSHSWGKD